jgi:TetR/AcrR family transcriptional regulator, cholesterol catabolism regulator
VEACRGWIAFLMAAGKDSSKQRRNRAAEVSAAALEVFDRKGYAGSSVQDVADRVGVLKGSLYHYIDSKESLLAQIFHESDAQSEEIMSRVTALETTAIDRLRAFAEEWSIWFMENVERSGLYVREWRHLTGDRRADVIAARRDYEDFVIGLIEASQEEGDVDRALEPRYATYLVLSAINGLPSWYSRGGPDSPATIAAVYAEMIVALLRGFRLAERS